jgi:hypothetical protein
MDVNQVYMAQDWVPYGHLQIRSWTSGFQNITELLGILNNPLWTAEKWRFSNVKYEMSQQASEAGGFFYDLSKEKKRICGCELENYEAVYT